MQFMICRRPREKPPNGSVVCKSCRPKTLKELFFFFPSSTFHLYLHPETPSTGLAVVSASKVSAHVPEWRALRLNRWPAGLLLTFVIIRSAICLCIELRQDGKKKDSILKRNMWCSCRVFWRAAVIPQRSFGLDTVLWCNNWQITVFGFVSLISHKHYCSLFKRGTLMVRDKWIQILLFIQISTSSRFT